MALSLEEMFTVVGRETRNKVFGVVPAIVTNNKDDDGHYRVKVRFPWLPNGGDQNPEESWWCRIATPMAGKARGFFNLPEVGDEVLVAFEHGDINRPYVIGMLWNTDDTTTYDNKSQDGKNHIRAFKSRSGHYLEFNDNDKDKKEMVTIKTKAGAYILLDDTDNAHKIHIQDQDGKQYMTIDKQGKKITIESTSGDIVIKAKEKIQLEAKTIEVKSTEASSWEAGKTFDLKASGNMTLKSTGGSGTLESSSGMTVKGSTVNIN